MVEFQIDKGRDSIIDVLDELRSAGATVTDLKTEQGRVRGIIAAPKESLN